MRSTSARVPAGRGTMCTVWSTSRRWVSTRIRRAPVRAFPTTARSPSAWRTPSARWRWTTRRRSTSSSWSEFQTGRIRNTSKTALSKTLQFFHLKKEPNGRQRVQFELPANVCVHLRRLTDGNEYLFQAKDDVSILSSVFWSSFSFSQQSSLLLYLLHMSTIYLFGSL